MNSKSAEAQFELEVKNLLSGYLGSEIDTIDYLAFKICKLHDLYFGGNKDE